MPNRNFVFAGLLAVAVTFSVAFSNAKPEEKEAYDYVTIQQNDIELFVTEQGKAPTQELLKKEMRNLNTAYALINKYEAQGYELYDRDAYASTGNLWNSFLLRRKK